MTPKTVPSSEMHIEKFTWKTHKLTTGLTYRYIDQAPNESCNQVGTVLCFHGFPDFAYGFRYQILELNKRGYRVIVPDQLGYGGTDKPDGRRDLAPYSLQAACNAADEILRHENVEKDIVVLGHDWGGAIGWRFVQYYTDRVKCYVSLCTPPSPAAQIGDPVPDLHEVVKNYPSFGYQLWLTSPEAEEEIKQNVREFIMLGYWNTWSDERKPDDGQWAHEGELEKIYGENLEKLKKAVPPSHEFQEYVDTFVKGGISGALNWYKTRVINYEQEIQHQLPVQFPTTVPCLMLAAENDGALPPSMTSPEILAYLFPGGNIEKKVINNADHWLLQDDQVRDEVVKTVADWVDGHVHGQANVRPSSRPEQVSRPRMYNVNVY